MKSTHVAFADESNWNEGRYRSICLVSAHRSDAIPLHRTLARQIEAASLRELKWSEVRRGVAFRLASEVMLGIVALTAQKRVRVDVLSWDTHDSRHDVQQRDDVANLQRMYFHLLRRVLRDSWPDGSIWALYPDHHGQMDWSVLEDRLDRRAKSWVEKHDLFTRQQIRIREAFRIERLEPRDSRDLPLIQVADLFAGVSAFSRKRADEYRSWCREVAPQRSLVAMPSTPRSKGDIARFELLGKIDAECKKARLGVSLRRHGALRTMTPAAHLNFWWYEPQGPYDKAPVRLTGVPAR